MTQAAQRCAVLWILWVLLPLVACSTTSHHPEEEPGSHSRFITDRETERVIVFIHGLTGAASKTWLNSKSQAYWPDLFAQDPDLREKYAVYVVDYGSPFLSRASTIEELAIRIHQQLVDQQFYVRFKEVYFVTHSMGGLIAKRMLVELNRPSELQKLQRVRAVLFLSTPAQGAELADIAAWLSLNPQVKDLKPADLNGFLQSLENQWLNVLRDRDQARQLFPKSFCAYETLPTFGVTVVNRVYATTRCDLNLFPIDRNHSDIVKPKDQKDVTYTWTKARIQETHKLINGQQESLSTQLPKKIFGKDGAPMVLVPEGEFEMGGPDFHPHKVRLDDFYIDQYEVTVQQYNQFMDQKKPPKPKFWEQLDLSRDVQKPVVGINWDSALAYCVWAEKRLPTEAEWEKAAKGTDNRFYPWGATPPNSTLVNFGKKRDDESRVYAAKLKRVGSYEQGKSPNEAYDMAGNVWEWVADWYEDNYYFYSPTNNPLGPASSGQEEKVIRGGSWDSNLLQIRTYQREKENLNKQDEVTGFRCAQDPS